VLLIIDRTAPSRWPSNPRDSVRLPGIALLLLLCKHHEIVIQVAQMNLSSAGWTEPALQHEPHSRRRSGCCWYLGRD